MGGAYNKYGGEKRCIPNTYEKMRKSDYLEDPGVDGKILKRIFQKWEGDMGWIDLASE